MKFYAIKLYAKEKFIYPNRNHPLRPPPQNLLLLRNFERGKSSGFVICSSECSWNKFLLYFKNFNSVCFIILSLLKQEREILWKSQYNTFIQQSRLSQKIISMKGKIMFWDTQLLWLYNLYHFDTDFIGNCRLVDFFIFDSDCFTDDVSLCISSSLPGGCDW